MVLSLFLDDWSSMYGDPTKFGLGVFSILFDTLFIVQHYVIYRNNSPYELHESIDTVIDNPSSENQGHQN